MSKELYVLLDPGHGGTVAGEYVTPGKRSPKLPDGSQLYEGVFNRKVVAEIAGLLDGYGIRYTIVAPGQVDTKLSSRVNLANDIAKKNPNYDCLYVSVHGNAASNDWHPASGIEVFTSPGQTRSDEFAQILIDRLKDNFPDVRFRQDTSDGDDDKEALFYVLRKTSMPAVLSENGFFSNKEECAKMFTDEWVEGIASAHAIAILEWKDLIDQA